MLALLLFFFFVGSIFSVCFLDCFPFFCIVSLFVSCFLPRLSFSSFLLLLEFRDYCQFFLLVFEDIFADFFFSFFLLLNSSATLVLSTPYIRVVSLSSSFTLYGLFCPAYLRVNTPLTSLSSNASHVPCLRRIVGLRSLNPTLYIEVIFIPRRFTSARLSRLGFGMSVSAQGLLHPVVHLFHARIISAAFNPRVIIIIFIFFSTASSPTASTSHSNGAATVDMI